MARIALVPREKKNTAFQNCNLSVDGFFRNNYTLFKNFTVFFKPTQQSFTRQDYGVYLRYFWICSAKLSLSCNDHLVKVKYSEEYKVFKDFSFSSCKNHYNYRGFFENSKYVGKDSLLLRKAVHDKSILHCGQAVQCVFS